MDIDQFWHSIRTNFFYKSPQKRCFFSKNLPGWASFVYYAQVITTIIKDCIAEGKGEFNREQFAKSSLAILKTVESAGGKIEISGLEEVNKNGGPFVYIANHMSMVDTFVLPCITMAFSDVTYVLKEDLLHYPIFGKLLKSINPIGVTRINPRDDLRNVLKKGQELIAKGYSIIIFPQTTRSAVFDADSFNSLGVKLAGKAKVPVVPIALKTDFQSNGRIVKDMGTVKPGKTLCFKFGDPSYVGNKAGAVHKKVVNFIGENLKAWGSEVKNL